MRAGIFFVPMLLVSSEAVAQAWTHEYAVGRSAEEITSCNAKIDYRDGTVIVRIYGEIMDIFFWHSSLSVPRDTNLGNVALTIKSEVIVAPAGSVGGEGATTSGMFFTPAKDDYGRILNAMRYGTEMGVYFPDGTGYTIELTGSNEALTEAARCWSTRPTGPAGRNPFLGSSGNNPFE